ncbi:MAG: hypothetical protein K2H85_11935, partial [Allobaculum sp.]|nr:hypothetical protein [Allobaculum sp.]
ATTSTLTLNYTEISQNFDLIEDGKLTLEKGNYKLTSNLDLSKSIIILANTKITLDLNGYDIESTAQTAIFLEEGSFLEIVGKGKINYSYPTTGCVVGYEILMCQEKASLKINPGVELVKTSKASTYNGENGVFLYGIGITWTTVNDTKKYPYNTKVEVNSAQITVNGGIYVNGNIDKNGPTINLTNTTINSNGTESAGIYQAGQSIINLVDSTIESDVCGIESRAGELNIFGGSVTGGSGKSGSTTENAGIAIAQHTTGLSVLANIVGTTISGNIGVLITNPENATAKNDPEKVSVVVSNVTFNNCAGAAVGYTEDGEEKPIKFSVVNPQGTQESDIKKFENAKSGSHELQEVMKAEPYPYTLIAYDLSDSE